MADSFSLERAVEAAKALRGDGPVVVVFASADYAEALDNWIGFARRAGAERILVAAVDDRAAATAAANGIASVLIPGILNRRALWVARAQLFSELARVRVDFVHSDVDAVWLRPPIEEARSLDVDIAFSTGTVWPRTAFDRWGFVVCCGFFVVRSSDVTAAFFSEVSKRALVCGDDQVAVNEALLDMGLTWNDAALAQLLSFGGQVIRTFAEPLVGRASKLSVGLLPHRRFPRLPEVSAETIVAHPLVAPRAGVNAAERLWAVLAPLGLWEPGARPPVNKPIDGRSR